MILAGIHSAAVTIAGGVDSRSPASSEASIAGMTGQLGGISTEIDTLVAPHPAGMIQASSSDTCPQSNATLNR